MALLLKISSHFRLSVAFLMAISLILSPLELRATGEGDDEEASGGSVRFEPRRSMAEVDLENLQEENKDNQERINSLRNSKKRTQGCVDRHDNCCWGFYHIASDYLTFVNFVILVMVPVCEGFSHYDKLSDGAREKWSYASYACSAIGVALSALIIRAQTAARAKATETDQQLETLNAERASIRAALTAAQTERDQAKEETKVVQQQANEALAKAESAKKALHQQIKSTRNLQASLRRVNTAVSKGLSEGGESLPGETAGALSEVLANTKPLEETLKKDLEKQGNKESLRKTRKSPKRKTDGHSAEAE